LFKKTRTPKEKGQGLVEYALILVLVSVVVLAVLFILGPVIGNVFTEVNSTLTTSGAAATAIPAGPGCDSVHADGYATAPGYGWDCYSPTFGAYNMP